MLSMLPASTLGLNLRHFCTLNLTLFMKGLEVINVDFKCSFTWYLSPVLSLLSLFLTQIVEASPPHFSSAQ